jgi:hypothetical protein
MDLGSPKHLAQASGQEVDSEAIHLHLTFTASHLHAKGRACTPHGWQLQNGSLCFKPARCSRHNCLEHLSCGAQYSWPRTHPPESPNQTLPGCIHYRFLSLHLGNFHQHHDPRAAFYHLGVHWSRKMKYNPTCKRNFEINYETLRALLV